MSGQSSEVTEAALLPHSTRTSSGWDNGHSVPLPASGGLDIDVFADGRGRRDGQAVFKKTFDVKIDGFTDQGFDLGQRFRDSRTAWQIGNCGSIAGRSFLDHDGVFHKRPHFNPACFKTLLKVLGGTSTEGFPAMVTLPGF